MLNVNDFIKLIENTDNKQQIKLIVECLDACWRSVDFMGPDDWVTLSNAIADKVRKDDMK